MKGRRDTLSTGRKGEALAAEFLIKKGFRVYHTNWRTGHKELDIVAGKENKVHFWKCAPVPMQIQYLRQKRWDGQSNVL